MTHPRLTRRAQRGAAAVLLLFLIGAVVTVAAFSSDGSRMTADAAQLKRATDAAAMAAAFAYAKAEDADIQAVAQRYVNANLGMDAAQTASQLRVQTGVFDSNGEPAVRVSATFSASALLGGAGPADVTVSSAALAVDKSLEVSLALPNSLSESGANLAALRRLGKNFAQQLIEKRSNTWLALVPYSQSVSVHDAAQPGRLQNWARAGALRPVELTTLFQTGYTGLGDRRMPDRRANLLCMYRGLNQGENYHWEQPPGGQFQIYYRADLPINDTIQGINPFTLTWVGPNPINGQANGVNDIRTLITDRGCPSAALLPLSNDLNQIGARLDAMSARFNTNYAIAMGWSAMALAPAFRGGAGWALDDDLPRDFDETGSRRTKAIVFLVNSTGQRWFDTDAYNAQVGQRIDGTAAVGSGTDAAVVTRRFANLCASLRARHIKFFLITVGNDEATDENGRVASASEFRRIAGAGLDGCAEKSSDQVYLTGTDFASTEQRIKDRLDAIAEELRQQGSSVRLIE